MYVHALQRLGGFNTKVQSQNSIDSLLKDYITQTMALGIEKMKKIIENLKPVPLPEHDGVCYPSFITFREKGAAQTLQDNTNFQSRETDIMICTYPKSGSHWINEITNMLIRKKAELDNLTKASTMLETISDFSVTDILPSPRLLNTHCQFQYLPKKHIENRSKIIHLIRNPKDTCVSYYHHSRKEHIFLSFFGTWNEFFDMWMSGKCAYGSWYTYEKEIEQAEKDFPGMIFTCSYEEIKKDPKAEIRKLADFLEVQCTDTLIEDIAKATSFENMKENKVDLSKAADGITHIYRKGIVGDWKNHFTVAQNEQFDAQYAEEFQDSSYKYMFD
ncbi:sulfotransferase 1B1-like isoform X2 [Mytilus californianus]|uniref:sulfotransferase 1B1-like isoform X2 n=1 Tax=Mytilus californianus TaxID=6549 RepID=UPI002246F7DF|nr:sulfotransferase 1B1-like isoform X2 [Mytilus californianus]